MLDLGLIEKTIKIDYADDESYEIQYITDEFIRQRAAEDGVDLENVVTSMLVQSGPDETEENETLRIFKSIRDAVFNRDFVIDVACEAVKTWTGIVADGKPLPCNDENKRLVFDKFSNRARFIYSRCFNEKLFMNTTMEADLKNS